jgi:hypothetical protein
MPDHACLSYLKWSNSQKQGLEWWLPGPPWRGKWGIAVKLKFQIRKMDMF